MKDEIVVKRNLGIISKDKSSWQKELNIVSINGGPFKYDFREWSLDHTSCRNGISFSNEEAKTLFFALKKCLNNLEDENEPISNDDLCTILQENNLIFIDKREKGGALWVPGGRDLEHLMAELRKKGYYFIYSSKGGKATKNQPAWFMRP